MKTIQTELFSYKELSDEAKEKVVEVLIKERENDSCALDYAIDEFMDSVRSICRECNFRLGDYSIGTYSQNWKLKVIMGNEDPKGNKALAWFLRVLIDKGYERPKRFSEMKFTGVCGFTGVHTDEIVCESIWKSLLEGDRVSKAFDSSAYTICKNLEEQYEYDTSKEGILENLDIDEEVYMEDGAKF